MINILYLCTLHPNDFLHNLAMNFLGGFKCLEMVALSEKMRTFENLKK